MPLEDMWYNLIGKAETGLRVVRHLPQMQSLKGHKPPPVIKIKIKNINVIFLKIKIYAKYPGCTKYQNFR